jgi:hypothetical protein
MSSPHHDHDPITDSSNRPWRDPLGYAVHLNRVERAAVHWLSPGRLAAGKITVLDGELLVSGNEGRDQVVELLGATQPAVQQQDGRPVGRVVDLVGDPSPVDGRVLTLGDGGGGRWRVNGRGCLLDGDPSPATDEKPHEDKEGREPSIDTASVSARQTL